MAYPLRICLLLLLLLSGCVFKDSFHLEDPPTQTSDFLAVYPQGPYSEPLHADPKVGQYWLTVSTDSNPGAIIREEGKCIALRVEDCVIVEHQYTYRDIERKGDKFQWVVACMVNPADPEHRVLRAWNAEKGDPPKELSVIIKPPKPVEDDADGYQVEREPFTREIGEQVFHGTVTHGVKKDDRSVQWRTWVADDGWFDQVVEVTTGTELWGFSYKVTEARIDVKAWINWEGVDTRPDYVFDYDRGFALPRK